MSSKSNLSHRRRAFFGGEFVPSKQNRSNCTIRGKLYYLYLVNEKMNKLVENSIKLLENADQEVYLNLKRFTNLSCIVRLLQHKVLNKCRDKSVKIFLLFLKRYCLKARHYQVHFTRQ